MTLRIEEIRTTHNRKKFDCGEVQLNNFLKTTARQSHTKMATRTYVLIDEQGDVSEILGYYTLLPSLMFFPADHPLRNKFPENPPVYRLARLAVDQAFQGRRLGEFLLINAIARIVEASHSIGGIGCVVDAKNTQVKAFYEIYGFTPIEKTSHNSLCLWLPYAQCAQVLNLIQN